MVRRRALMFLWLVPVILAVSLLIAQLAWYLGFSRLQWELQLQGELITSCVDPASERLYILMGDATGSGQPLNLYCLSSRGGQIWRSRIGSHKQYYWHVQLEADQDGVLVRFADRSAVRFDNMGRQLWDLEDQAEHAGSDLPGGEAVDCLSRGGLLVGYDRQGEAKWEVPFEQTHLSALEISSMLNDGFFLVTFIYSEPSTKPPNAQGIPPPAGKITIWRRYSTAGELLHELRIDGLDASALEKHMFGNGAAVFYYCHEHGTGYISGSVDPARLFHAAPAGGEKRIRARAIQLDDGMIRSCQSYQDSLLLLAENLWRIDPAGELQQLGGPETFALVSGTDSWTAAFALPSPLGRTVLGNSADQHAVEVQQLPRRRFSRPRWRIAGFSDSNSHDRPALSVLGTELLVIQDRYSGDGQIDISCYR